MINEHNGGQANLPTSTSMSYGYQAGHFERLNMQTIRSPTDSYSYYTPNMYQGFSSFEESNQFASTDLAGSLGSAPGPMTYHPSLYTPSPPFDISHNVFDYSSAPNPYSHYHPMGFNHASNFSGPGSSTAVTNFDMFWSPHNLSHQHQQQQQQQQPIPMGPIQTSVPSTASLNSMANDKQTSYDPYLSSTSSRLPDILAQRMNLMQLANTPISQDVYQQYHQTPNETGSNVGNFSQNQASFTSLSNNVSSSSSNYQKSYALVVSSDSNTRNSMKQTSTNPNHSNSNLNRLSNNGNLSQQQASGYQKNFHAEQNSFSASSDYHNSNPTVKLSERSMNNNDGANRRQISGRHKSATKGENPNQDALGNLVQQHQYNPKQFNLNPKGARFFVIKSYSEDDVHRSIKYKIWCSTEHGNKRLDTAFREREGKGPVYLFFSVNGSGHFCGMAEMVSPVDYEHKTDVWHMSNKWQGKFEVKWIYVKDVPNQQFRHIRLENNENKPVTNSRDTQEVLYEKGKLVLKVLHFYQHKTSIFDDFFYYESKQVEEDTKKSSIDEWHEN